MIASSTRPRRPRLVTFAVTVGLLALPACSEVQVVHTSATPTPTAVATLPPIGFNHRYGNTPLAAADAFAMERVLYAKKEYWESALATQPVAAGYVDRSDLAAIARARSATRELVAVIASESLLTIRAFLANGHPGQQAYCVSLLDQLRSQGYDGLTKVTMYVYFGEQDRHAELTWTPAAGYGYQVFDNDLQGTAINPSATPFQSIPALTPTPSG